MPQKTKPTTRARKAQTKKRDHLRQFHILRLYSFGALAAGLLAVQFIAGLQANTQQRRDVLAYATAVSVSGLYDATNQARAANGLGALAINGKLNNGAQAKANDMIAKNYWSHTSPDGTQPWQFFLNAGYSYTRAGENLAYGFDTSGQVVDGWMNSAGHRANLLGNYVDVGFGIASGPNYQGGENTVVVSFYGTPQATPAPAPAPAPTAAPTAPAPKPSATTTPKPVASTPAPAPTPAPTPTPATAQAQPAAQKQAAPSTAQANAKPAVVATNQNKKVTNLEAALGGQAGWAMYASLGVLGVTSIGFAGTHVQLVRRGWKVSRHYILVHPALDTAVLAAVGGIILTSASGFIK